MKWLSLVIFSLILAVVRSHDSKDVSGERKFPNDFLFGTATASYQIEGAWNVDGRTESIWDYMTHTDPCSTKDCLNGDDAAKSYYYWQRDVEMLRQLGVDFYRFSISWSRLLPTGFTNHVNEHAVEYYNNLINELIKYNIHPMITLYHWDLPQSLQLLGGWANPLVVEWFHDYSRVCYALFGDRVKFWITFNEPRQICYEGYGEVVKAPRLNMTGVGEYICARNLLLAHAKSWHLYDKQFRPSQGGINGITINLNWFEPATNSNDDEQAAQDARMFEWGTYVHPIFSDSGDFPPELKSNVATRSAEQGWPTSRLPEFTPEEISLIRDSADFFGINTYTTRMVYRYDRSKENLYVVPSYMDDMGAVLYADPSWDKWNTSRIQNVPWGFYNLLKFVREKYNNPTVYITENGWATETGLDDPDRVFYYRNYLSAMLDAIDEGSDVRGYAAWSLMDNFEWMQGYTERFGLFEVDMEAPNRTRTPRTSAYVYKHIISTRAIDCDYSVDPHTAVMTIDIGH